MKIGFIGLGIMGSRMAANLLKQDIDLHIHNRSRPKATPLLEQGAQWANTPSELGQSDIIFTMLAHPEAVTKMALGPDGFLAHMQPNTLWVDCSTVHPRFSQEMATAAQAQQVRFLDAPVAGTKPHAEQAQLTFFVGGDTEALSTAQPYFDMMGQRVVHLGHIGMGTSLKVVVNMLLATAMATFAEGMALGQSLGLTQETLLNALLGGPVVAPFLNMKRQSMTSGTYDTAFPLQWMQKDLQMAALAAYDNGVPLPIVHATKEVYGLAIQDGFGQQDFSAIYAYLTEKQR